MSEAVYNAAGLGLPIVMTVANRAIGAPINIWNDHSDAMSQRDAGWIQLYATDNQAAIDLHVIAFALADELSVPVMVCVDGFVLTHAFEPLDVPSQDQVDDVLPAGHPRQRLDPDDPVSIGAMVGPEAFTEVRYLSQYQLVQAIEAFPEVAHRLGARVGRERSMVEPYWTGRPDTVIVTLGSVTGTVQDVADEVGGDVGVLAITMFRPFPYTQVRAALEGVRRVIVLERAFAPGAAGIVTADVRTAVAGWPCEIHTVVAGLGGRAVSKASLHEMLRAAAADELGEVSFLDLRHDIVDREIARLRHTRGGGSTTLNVLREAGIPGSRIG